MSLDDARDPATTFAAAPHFTVNPASQVLAPQQAAPPVAVEDDREVGLRDAAMPAATSRERQYAYLGLRLLTGLNFFGHGYARLFTGTFLQGFVDHTVQSMARAPLSPALVSATAYAIPVVELVIGVLLLTGLLTRWAVYLAFLLMFVLMFGTTMAQNWPVAGDQLIYGLMLALLLFGRVPYDMSWLRLLRRN